MGINDVVIGKPDAVLAFIVVYGGDGLRNAKVSGDGDIAVHYVITSEPYFICTTVFVVDDLPAIAFAIDNDHLVPKDTSRRIIFGKDYAIRA